MVERFTNEIRRKIDGFKESQLQVSMFMADDHNRWVFERENRPGEVTLSLYDSVTGNSLLIVDKQTNK